MARIGKITWTVLQCLVLVLAAFLPGSHAAAASDKLPDLGMAKLKHLNIVNRDGRRLLVFSTIIVNIGTGPFEVYGNRPDTTTTTMSATQRIYDDAGGYRDVLTPSVMRYSGDGHDHWHLQELETYELIRLNDRMKVATGTKIGYCFFDNVEFKLSLPGAPGKPFYTGCGNRRSTAIKTGLSVGWGDIYRYKLAGQDLDITNLAPGNYRLQVTSDSMHWFAESNESNNVTWVDIQIKSKTGTNFSILSYGPFLK